MRFFEHGRFKMDRSDTSSMFYDPFATDLNEIYGLYRFTLSSPLLKPPVEGAEYLLRIYMKSHTAGVTSDYVEFPFMEWREGVHAEDHYFPFSRSFTFRSFNDIEGFQIISKTGESLDGVQTVTIEKLRTSAVYDSTPTVVTTLTGMDAGQVISI